MRDGMILSTSYVERFKTLTDEQFGKLIRSMIEYQTSGELPEIADTVVKISFDVVKVDIDRNNLKYEEICERRRAAGQKGGQASASKRKQMVANGSKSKQNVANQADKDKDKDKDIILKDNKENIKRSSCRSYVSDSRLNQAILDFIEHRKKLRKPMTDKAVELFINRVNKMAPNNIESQITLIETAIGRGWQTVYPSNEKAEQIQSPGASDKLRALEDYYLQEV